MSTATTSTVIRATGEHSDQVGDLLSGSFDIALLTYEKFSNLVLATPHILRGLSVVIVDEVQTLSDPSRGANLEFLLTILRSGLGRGTPPQIVALSAVIGQTHGLEDWLGGGLLRTEERPVPLRERVLSKRQRSSPDAGAQRRENDRTQRHHR